MHTRRTVLAGTAAFAASPALAADDPFAPVDRLLAKLVSQERLPCAAIRVARHGRTLFEGHYSGRVKVGPGSLYRIYSMTKPVTACAVMALCDDGKLNLETPVAELVPEFAALKVMTTSPADTEPARPMTVAQLLTHSSGIASSWSTPALTPAYRKAGLDADRPDRQWLRHLAADLPDPGGVLPDQRRHGRKLGRRGRGGRAVQPARRRSEAQRQPVAAGGRGHRRRLQGRGAGPGSRMDRRGGCQLPPALHRRHGRVLQHQLERPVGRCAGTDPARPDHPQLRPGRYVVGQRTHRGGYQERPAVAVRHQRHGRGIQRLQQLDHRAVEHAPELGRTASLSLVAPRRLLATVPGFTGDGWSWSRSHDES
ncbi:serine hydrolase [Caulobacter sp. SLTY]|nr:serine hydrolase [Caulobacter sp. SLTY]